MSYKTIKEPVISDFKVKKSRFIGYIKPISKKKDAEEFIEHIRKKNYDARHNVPVYLIGEDFEIQKYSDDGEPSKTAGYPILDMLKNQGFTNIVVVVTRYFGGVKLGTGGLVRAYTKSIKLALEKAIIIEKRKYKEISFKIDYTLHGKIINYINTSKSIELISEDFTDVVKINIFIKPEKFDKIKKELIDITSGSVNIDFLGLKYLSFIDNKRLE